MTCMHSQSCLFATLWTVVARLLCPWNFPGKNTRVGCHFLLSDSEIEPAYLVSPALSDRFFTTVPLGSSFIYIYIYSC